MLDERSVQTVSAPFSIFKNEGNVESMLNESLNQFKFDSTHFQQAINICLCFQQRWTTRSNAPNIWFNNCGERMLNQMMKRDFRHAAIRRPDLLANSIGARIVRIFWHPIYGRFVKSV